MSKYPRGQHTYRARPRFFGGRLHLQGPAWGASPVDVEPLATALRFVRIARRLSGKTLGEVARKAGMSPVVLSNIELGRVVPRVDQLQRIEESMVDTPELLETGA